jgi:site-specific recombinase XerD
MARRRTGASRSVPRLGKQPPRYCFFLNPYRDVRFTTCPQGGGKTRQRKLPLVIHVDPVQLIALNKTCRYCPGCDLLIAHQDEVEAWQAVLAATATESLGNRLMLALAYDAALRREELCALAVGAAYLRERRALSRERGPLFISASQRNRGKPISIWTWSKVVAGIAARAGVPRFSTHTLCHLCLTDLARAGWDIHEIAQLAGHRGVQTTVQHIHLSGRDLAAKLERGMAEIHAWRTRQLAEEVP